MLRLLLAIIGAVILAQSVLISTQMISICQKEMSKRQAKSGQIQAAGARQLRQLQSMPDVNQGEIHCNNCGHVRPATSDRCGSCGSF